MLRLALIVVLASIATSAWGGSKDAACKDGSCKAKDAPAEASSWGVRFGAMTEDFKVKIGIKPKEAPPRHGERLKAKVSAWGARLGVVKEDVNSKTGTSDVNIVYCDNAPCAYKNAGIWAVIHALGLGFFGLDRCYLGNYIAGTAKGLTLGGFFIVAIFDYVVFLFHIFQEKMSIEVDAPFDAPFDVRANFELDSLDAGFYIAILSVFVVPALKFHFFHKVKAKLFGRKAATAQDSLKQCTVVELTHMSKAAAPGSPATSPSPADRVSKTVFGSPGPSGPTVFEVNLDHSMGGRYGFQFNKLQPDHLFVMAVYEAGLIASYNKTVASGKGIESGDHILSVNGVKVPLGMEYELSKDQAQKLVVMKASGGAFSC